MLRDRGLDCRVLRVSTIPMCDDERRQYRPDRFLGAVRPEVIARELPDQDLLLMPSEPEEGFGAPAISEMKGQLDVATLPGLAIDWDVITASFPPLDES